MKLTCIGSGKMGTAVLKGIVTRGLCAAENLTISDPSSAALAAAAARSPWCGGSGFAGLDFSHAVVHFPIKD